MRPRLVQRDYRPYGSEWCWLYDQPTVLLRGQSDLLARLMIAEVVDTDILQAIMLRWATRISMYAHVEWMSVRWVQSILGSLDEEDGCLGRRMESFESVEDKVGTFRSNHISFNGAVWTARLDFVAGRIDQPPLPPTSTFAPSEDVLQA